jgi:hypothetical protein
MMPFYSFDQVSEAAIVHFLAKAQTDFHAEQPSEAFSQSKK